MPTFQHGTATLYYELDGTGADAVYIPGMGSHSNDSLGQSVRQMLSPHYRLLTVDNRGSGQTTTAVGDASTLADMADDVAAVMEQVGMSSAHVLGLSMGGMIALSLAAHYPQKINRLVVGITSARTPDATDPVESEQYQQRIMREYGLTAEVAHRHNAIDLLGESVFRDAPEDVAWWTNPSREGLVQTQAGYELQSQALMGYDVRDALKQLDIPTLVMSNTEDRIVPPRYQDEIVSLIPDAQIKRYRGGHVYMMLPSYAPQFYADVLAFWRSKPE